MKVVLLIETVSREMASKFLLADALLQNNCTSVLIGNTHEVFYQLLWIKHDILFLTNGDFSRDKVTLLNVLKKKGVKIILLENEGGVFKDIAVQSERLSNKILNLIDLYFTWGKIIKEFVVSKQLILSDKVIVSGTPFFDTFLLKNQFVHNISVTNSLPKKKYILINTRFSLGNEFVPGQYQGLTSLEEVEFERKLIDHFINLALLLSEEYFIVFRPHPSENIETYQRAFINHSNILLTREHSAQFWIINCECLIHNGCTTGIEGVLAGKKVLSYMPVNNINFDMHLPNSVSVICTTTDEIYFYLKSNFMGNVNIDTSVSDYINNFNSPSIPIILNSLGSLGPSDSSFSFNIPLISLIRLYKRAITSKIKHTNLYFLVVKFFGAFYKEHLYQESKRKDFSKVLICLKNYNKLKLSKSIGYKYLYSISKH